MTVLMPHAPGNWLNDFWFQPHRYTYSTAAAQSYVKCSLLHWLTHFRYTKHTSISYKEKSQASQARTKPGQASSQLLHLPLREDNDNSLSQAGPQLGVSFAWFDSIAAAMCNFNFNFFRRGASSNQSESNQIKSTWNQLETKRKFSSFAQLAVYESNVCSIL